jgi:hypothetical protein
MSQVLDSIADHPAMTLTTVDVGSQHAETTSPRLTVPPVACPEIRHIPPFDHAIDAEAQENHVGGCLRGVLFALVFQSAVIVLFFLLFKIWQMIR